MSNLAKLDFVALDISGKNYLQWVLDAEIHLAANGLGETIKEKNTTTDQEKAKAMIFLRHHLNEGLKYEYLTVKDPLTIWTNLKERYDHLKTVILPKARYDWIHLRLQDFKSISDYNSAMYGITSQLALCGEKVSDADMLEKTYQTFHGSQLLLSQQYRQRGFKKYSELTSCLLVAEQNNEILLKNHQSRPTGSDPFPEVNAIKYDHKNKGPDHASSRGRGRGRGYRQGRGNNFGNYRGGRGGQFKRSYSHQKWEQNASPHNKDKKNVDNFCNRCGCKGHWSRTCRTRKHFVDLYQQSLNNKRENKIEANFAAENDKIETNFADGKDNYGGFLDVSNFFFRP
ncbi:hypothetical protein RND81_14G161900 [Saponaria officinalis]|uniref:CCHC-type domain-containing protein n=1 Tax=Saponaria officinalis TaxID=3572 RepID=A0AAW1GUM9_SAPOF